MVVLEREDYNNKARDLLNTPAYKEIPKDPTNRIKTQLITKLRKIKKDSKLDEGMYRTMYPTGCVLPKFYGLPKIHKTGTPLRPIVSSRGSVTYGAAKVLTRVIQPLVGKSPNHIQVIYNIIELLGFCLHNTYFSFQNKFYEQVEGAPMGSPVSPIIANLYMESFERKALRSANNPLGMV